MPKINVVKAFKLTLDDGRTEEFVPGQYNVPKEVADHWFTKAHLADFEPPPPPEGSHEWMIAADEQRRADRAAAQQEINDTVAAAAAVQEEAARRAEEMIRQAQFRAAEQIETAAAKGGTVPNAPAAPIGDGTPPTTEPSPETAATTVEPPPPAEPETPAEPEPEAE